MSATERLPRLMDKKSIAADLAARARSIADDVNQVCGQERCIGSLSLAVLLLSQAVQELLEGEAVVNESLLAARGVEMIAAERKRQIDAEGWTPEHDDEHSGGEMAWAAASYAIPAAPGPIIDGETAEFWNADRGVPSTWPDWEAEWWKPCPEDRVRELVKAGALIAAEIDRLQRLES